MYMQIFATMVWLKCREEWLLNNLQLQICFSFVSVNSAARSNSIAFCLLLLYKICVFWKFLKCFVVTLSPYLCVYSCGSCIIDTTNVIPRSLYTWKDSRDLHKTYNPRFIQILLWNDNNCCNVRCYLAQKIHFLMA